MPPDANDALYRNVYFLAITYRRSGAGKTDQGFIFFASQPLGAL
jgi:hypothetical protein